MISLNSEYLKSVRFTVRRGTMYDAREVDAFMDALIEAVSDLEHSDTEKGALDKAKLETVCEIRAEMTEIIMKEILRAEKRITPLLDDVESAENFSSETPLH